MQVKFDNKHIEALYKKGASKKYPLQPQILTTFFMRIQQLEAAATIYDLWNTPSIRFKKLHGFENRFSLRIDGAMRLEVELTWQDQANTVGIVHIVEISKHYGD